MLGGKGIHEINAVVEFLHEHHPGTVLERFLQLHLAAESLNLTLDLGIDGVEELL